MARLRQRINLRQRAFTRRNLRMEPLGEKLQTFHSSQKKPHQVDIPSRPPRSIVSCLNRRKINDERECVRMGDLLPRMLLRPASSQESFRRLVCVKKGL